LDCRRTQRRGLPTRHQALHAAIQDAEARNSKQAREFVTQARGLVSILLGQALPLTDYRRAADHSSKLSSPYVPLAKSQLTSDRQVPNNARMPISQLWHCLAAAEPHWALPNTYPPCSQGACGRLVILREFGIERAYGKACPNISWIYYLRPMPLNKLRSHVAATGERVS
jgi:hypothetical protein